MSFIRPLRLSLIIFSSPTIIHLLFFVTTKIFLHYLTLMVKLKFFHSINTYAINLTVIYKNSMAKEKIPYIKVKPPGKKASEWVKKDNQFVSKSYTRSYPLVVEKAYGMTVEDVDGNRYLDFTAGIATCSTGHCHPG